MSNVHNQITNILAGGPLPPEVRKRVEQTVRRDYKSTTGPNREALAACILLLLEKIERIEGELNPADKHNE